MYDRLLTVPQFARLNDYVGLWSMEANALAALTTLIARTDLPRHMAISGGRPTPSTMELVPAKNGKNVAVVRIAGTMMKSASSFGGTSTIQLRRDIRNAAADPNVSGILLAVDSPGGSTAGTADLAAEVKKARSQKPVWGFVDELCASACLWVVSQADVVYANGPTALIGSVGTFATVVDSSAAAEKDGVKVLVFSTGPLKGMGTSGTAITQEQADHLQKLVDESQTHFDSAVKTGRGLTAKQMETVRTGAMFTAAEAKELRLIDGIKTLEQTLAALAAAK